ncbi:MAG: CoA pyrophosphatase [Leptospirales bacterium]|nr:CoA pyrophosphatase [Leptospirales bacterium]
MNMQFDNAEGFNNFKKFISERLLNRTKRSVEFPEYKKAAVLIIFMEMERSPYVLLTLRTDRVSTHKGQVSFPGGGFDPSDKNMLDTALRETMEEVGINPDEIEILGEFDEYVSIMGFQVYTFVGALNRVQKYTPSKDEIDIVFEAPFSIFYNEEYTNREKINYGGRDYDVYYYEYNNITIWGLTARILTDFSRKVCKDSAVDNIHI